MNVQLNKFKRKHMICLILSSLILGFILYVLAPFPQKAGTPGEYPPVYYITNTNKFEQQPPNQCAAYATAYVLRNFGREVTGDEIYKRMSFKIPVSGYILPKGIITFVKKSGFKSEIYKGDLSNLKSKVAEGNPVVVLIGKGFYWQHYMTLVGYNDDKQELYFYDSKRTNDENNSLVGNRSMTEEYFMELWKNGLPIFNRVYISVSK
jgi:ABC-type bacteriocin/lantibiotic exporter with double-glycine peptidase domain